MKHPEKIQCLHPAGKHAPVIATDTYTLFEKAICNGLQGNKALSFTELVTTVQKYLDKQKIKFTGSAGWYAVAVKNHMESVGTLKTIIRKGKKLHMLT